MTAPTPEPTLRDQLAEALRKAFEHHIVAEWICCDPPQKGHKLCKRGHTALLMVRNLLDEDSTAHTQTSPVVDAVLSVVEAALTRARASCCGDGDRTYAEMERHLTERAEQAERERDIAVAAADPFKIERVKSLTSAMTRLVATERDDARQRAEQAEATVQRARSLADELASHAPDDDWGDSITRTAAADIGRRFLAALDQPADPPEET